MTATTRDDTPVAIQGDGVELRTRDVGGGMSVAFVRLPQGTDMGPGLEGLPDDMCQCAHWGYLLKGRLRMRTKDGADVYEAGQAFYWEPGHVPDALEDCEYVDFSPTKEFTEVIDHVKSTMG
ncbi:hypothetical protein ACFZBU_13120 [Embleya sp. NPDC008237]|uniref:hypothetical protein n=1 Tax=Embleya sp. NPDC008237 TaxID=3363978 RepID=UPI0036E28C9E